MSTNMTLITSVTVGSGGAASVTLPATGTIPATYTDLKVIYSARSTQASIAVGVLFTFNASTSNFSSKVLYGSGSSASSFSSARYAGSVPGSTATASTLSNNEIYIPNYTSSNYKSYSVDTVTENNATESYAYIAAGLWSDTPALTSLTLTPENGTFVEHSTFYLYGISNVTSTTKATGGIVSSDGTYNYHMFPYSGTFTPTTAISADVLVIAGGGGSTSESSGGGGAGGGAGGVCYQTSRSITAGSYTVTIGAGGAAVSTGSRNSGTNTIFDTITANGGGGAGFASNDSSGNPSSGGSGGGGGGYFSINNPGAAATQGNSGGATGYGNAGGGGITNNFTTGGGGGSGAVGQNGNGSTKSGDGGAGKDTWSSWASVTSTGVNGFYAGGGGGGCRSDQTPTPGAGGSGGGGAGAGTGGTAGSGVANTGSGGGGSNSGTAGSGGSGLVIIRYAI